MSGSMGENIPFDADSVRAEGPLDVRVGGVLFGEVRRLPDGLWEARRETSYHASRSRADVIRWLFE